VFGSRGTGVGTSSTWKPSEFGLRVDFTTPVTTVRLDAIGTASGDRARLEAYDRYGVLIGRYTTAPLADGQLETMQLQRPTADIAYVIAKAHSGIAVRLDRLRFGPETDARTDAQGAYAIPSLPAGDYFVDAVSPSGRVLTASRRAVTLAEGEALGHVDLIAHTGEIAWQNPVRPKDVTGEGDVTALDALVVINYINGHSGDLSVPASDVPPPYYDVDGNGLVTAGDVLLIINQLNNAAAGGGGISGLASGESPGGGSAEGEAAGVRSLPILPPPSSPRPSSPAVTADAGESDVWAANPTPDGPRTRADAVLRRLRPLMHPAASLPAVPADDSLEILADIEDVLSVLADDVAGAW
jgi:hypothetical protein